MSSTYTDVALLIVWSWDTIVSITDFIISGATFSPDPNCVRQKHWPLKTTIVPCQRGFEDMHFADLEATHWLLVATTLLVSVCTLLHWQWKHPQNHSIPGSQALDTSSASAWLPFRELDPLVGQVLLNMATAIHSAATVGSRSHRHPWHDRALRIPAHYYSVRWESDR